MSDALAKLQAEYGADDIKYDLRAALMNNDRDIDLVATLSYIQELERGFPLEPVNPGLTEEIDDAMAEISSAASSVEIAVEELRTVILDATRARP